MEAAELNLWPEVLEFFKKKTVLREKEDLWTGRLAPMKYVQDCMYRKVQSWVENGILGFQ